MLNKIASDHALERYGISRCMLVPIAALDEAAIVDNVGEIDRVLSYRARKAFLVKA